MKPLLLVWLSSAALFLLAPGSAQSQSFPSKSIRVVITTSPGGGPDAVMRILGEKMMGSGKGQIVVDNKPGANGWLAIDSAKRSPADGYTMLVADSPLLALQKYLYKKLPFDTDNDFEAVAPLYSTHFFVVVSANSPWKNMGDLLSAARAAPGRLTYGTWGIGSVAHVSTAILESQTNTRMTHVPFKEAPQIYTAVSSGEVDWAFGSAASVGPLYRDRRVRLLALAAPTRLAGYMEVPTVAESGGPADFISGAWVGLVARKGTPKVAIEHINAATNQALRDPTVQGRLAGFGFLPWIGSPDLITQAIKTDSLKYADIVRRTNMSVD